MELFTPILAAGDINQVDPVVFKSILQTLGWLFGLGAVIWGMRQKKTVITPQPLTVEIVKALHEQFADKDEFVDLKDHTTARHAQLFKAIEKVERDAREAMDKRFEALGVDRQAQIEKLNTQFTFIRENIVAIQVELKIRNAQHS
jgi:hypothetical protein